MACTCPLAAKLAPDALAALPALLQAALDRRPGAESLNAMAKRLEVRKGYLQHHREVCLGLPKPPGYATTLRAQTPKIVPDPSRDGPCPIVYFIGQGDRGPIKIGWTVRPVERRIAGLQTGNPQRLRLLYWEYGDAVRERELHREFSHLRIDSSEWFRPGADLLTYVREGASERAFLKRRYGVDDKPIPMPPAFDPFPVDLEPALPVCEANFLALLERFLEMAG